MEGLGLVVMMGPSEVLRRLAALGCPLPRRVGAGPKGFAESALDAILDDLQARAHACRMSSLLLRGGAEIKMCEHAEKSVAWALSPPRRE